LGGAKVPSPFNRRADSPRPAHRPYRAPASTPKRAHRTPVISPLSTEPRTPPSPVKPTMMPHARPNSPQSDARHLRETQVGRISAVPAGLP
jgi:hypothetical protein